MPMCDPPDLYTTDKSSGEVTSGKTETYSHSHVFSSGSKC
jgi:hypothetical protein